MATAALPAVNYPRLFGNEFRYELLKQVRNRIYLVASLGFPVMFYLLFGVANRHSEYHGISFAKYLLASYAIFGMMGSALFGVGTGLAIERGQGWLDLKRASPMPAPALLFAKCGTAIVFALVSCMLLILCGVTAGGVHITAFECVKLLSLVAIGTLPFAALGLMISFTLSATAAPGVMNLIYLPMSFCSGIWIPIMMLPKFVQVIAPFLPSYHLAQIGFRLLGFPVPGMSSLAHAAVVAAMTALFLTFAAVLYKRQNSLG